MSNNSICIISPSLKIGGIERALTELAYYFSNTQLQISFISCLTGDRFYFLDNNIKLFEPRFKHSGGLMNKWLFYPRVIFFIRKTVRKINPDVVMAFGDWFSPLVLLSLIGLKYPVYISDRTSPEYKFKFPIPQLKKWLYPGSAGFIAQTQRAADYKRKQFGNKLNIRVIPNALRDVKLYPDVPREKIVLYVGRFAWEKGPERLISAFAAIPGRQGWHLHMAGSGPLLDNMKNLAEELKIENEVVFYGKVRDVDRLYARAGIFVLPSVLEGFPNSLCEAMAAGLPCICFDSILYEEIFTDGLDGMVVKEGDIAGLTDSIVKLMKDESLREKMGLKAMEIRKRLSLESIGEQVKNFIFST